MMSPVRKRKRRIYQVTIGTLCYGVHVEGIYVREAAPVARWMRGKRWDDVKDWISRKGGTFQKVGVKWTN